MSANGTFTFPDSTAVAGSITMTPLNFTSTVPATPATTTPAPQTTTAPQTPPPSTTMTTTTTTATTTTMTTTMMPTTTTAVANTLFGLSMSNTILITVFTGCTALILLVVLFICCRLLCMKNKAQCPETEREHPQAARARSTRNHYADPYRVVENHYHSNDVTRLHYATPEITYAKPEIYSTFINPSFYEDVYARWRLQEQARHEKTYDSPWQYSRRQKEQSETPECMWSTQSLQAVDNYNYDKFSRIPRGKLTSESERDETETVAMDPQSFTTF